MHGAISSRSRLVGSMFRWTGWSSHCWRCRCNVLVEPEDVGGIVGAFEFGESCVVGPIGCSDAVRAFCAEIVDVNGVLEVWPEGGECFSGPADVVGAVL